EKVLTDLGKKVIQLPEGLKFSGQGDALACGDLLFCGKNYRSDEEAQEFAAKTLGYNRIQLETVPLCDNDGKKITNKYSGWPDSYFYDLDLALAIIKPKISNDKGLIAYCKEAFTAKSQQTLESLDIDKILVSYEEAVNGFASNLVSTGETVIMSAHAPQLATDLQKRGLKILTPEISELLKGGGYIRCVTLTLD
ncbi:MAG: dimethylarginine dimethylaminohydrolase family protein, partial [Thiobacillus sp.]